MPEHSSNTPGFLVPFDLPRVYSRRVRFIGRYAVSFAWLSLSVPVGVAASAELTSPSFRLIGANINAGSAMQLQSTALLPDFAGTGVSVGQSEALGFGGSLVDLRSVVPGFWPVATGDLPNLDTDGDGIQSFRDDDDDGDGLLDPVETGTGVFVSPVDTGTSPVDADSDGDGFGDGVEVDTGSDPTNSTSTPISLTPVPALGWLARLLLVGCIAVTAAWAHSPHLRWRRRR